MKKLTEEEKNEYKQIYKDQFNTLIFYEGIIKRIENGLSLEDLKSGLINETIFINQNMDRIAKLINE